MDISNSIIADSHTIFLLFPIITEPLLLSQIQRDRIAATGVEKKYLDTRKQNVFLCWRSDLESNKTLSLLYQHKLETWWMAIEFYLPFFSAIPFFLWIMYLTRSVQVSKMLTGQWLFHSICTQQIHLHFSDPQSQQNGRFWGCGGLI